MVERRSSRQDAIREVVRSQPIHTQHELVHELCERGFTCTQATVSRDIAAMGLCKLSDGIYVLAEDLYLQRMVNDFVIDAKGAANLVIIKAQPGTASGVAAAIDDAELPAVIGSVAGDDTVLVVTASNEGADALINLMRRLGAGLTSSAARA